jgi:hypothetical protein
MVTHYINRLPQPVSDVLRSQLSSPRDLHQRRKSVFLYFSQTAGVPDENISHLITEIVALLNCSNTSSIYDGLKPELELLQDTLTFIALGIKAYRNTELGQYVARAVNPALLGCITVLRELFHAIDVYRQGLWHTRIWSLWHTVWSSGFEMDEVASWRKKLIACRRSVGSIIMALYS